MMTLILAIIWFGYWSAEAGKSLPWSHRWQVATDSLPEIIIALSVGALFFWAFPLMGFAGFVLASAVAYGGKQAATWALLRWDTHVHQNPLRKSRWRFIVDPVAVRLGFRVGDEGYAWLWAAWKGFMMTLPIGGTGLLFHPLGHEIGSHAQGRLRGDPNMWKEIAGGGIGYGVPVFLFCLVMF